MTNPPTRVLVNGAALREIRVRTGISVVALAHEAGISRPYLTRIEVGSRPRVSEEVFAALAAALRIQDKRTLMGNIEASDVEGEGE